MSFEIKTNRAAWKAAVEAGAETGSIALAEQMLGDSRDYIPDDGEHTLRDNPRVGYIEKMGTGDRDLVWSNAYAGYQWYGQRIDGSHVVKNYTTPGTGSAWVDLAKEQNQDKWDTVAQNAFTKGLKGGGGT